MKDKITIIGINNAAFIKNYTFYDIFFYFTCENETVKQVNLLTF